MRPGAGGKLRPVLVYDDNCAFCRRWVTRLKRWDRRHVIHVLPLQDPTAPEVVGRSRDALQQAAHLVGPDGAVFSGAAAARELCRYLPFGWLGRAFFAIPGALPLAERAYRWIARTWGPVR